MELEQIKLQAEMAIREFLDVAKLMEYDLLVVGCSSSEVSGNHIGSHSSTDIAGAVFNGIYPVLKKHKIYLAAQCCEHLNRALIVERAAALRYQLDEVNVMPKPKAGGSFATAAYGAFESPTAVEFLKAHAGLDIGDTLIGMHLRHVAVPVRLSLRKIGEANLVCARTRLKFIGGERAGYDKNRL